MIFGWEEIKILWEGGVYLGDFQMGGRWGVNTFLAGGGGGTLPSRVHIHKSGGVHSGNLRKHSNCRGFLTKKILPEVFTHIMMYTNL